MVVAAVAVRERGGPVPGDRIDTDIREQTDLRGLLEATAAGNRAAYARLYDLVSPRIYGLALRILRDRHLAQEIAQDVLLQLWQHAPRFDASRGHPMAWIMHMAHGRAVDHVRHCEAAAARDSRYSRLHSGTDAGDVVVEAVFDKHDRSEVRAALDGLSALQRQAITLAFYDGHTYAAIADLTGCPVGTIKSRIRDGLIRLGSIMNAA